MDNSITLPNICSHLLTNTEFITAMRVKLTQPVTIYREDFDKIIQQLSQLISLLLQRKLEKEMSQLIADNNAILEEIKANIEKQGNRGSDIRSNKNIEDHSFTEIHNIIHQQRKKMLDQLNDAEVEKSMSMVGHFDDFVDKVNDLQKKVKSMEDKYQTNLKSLWNVLSMTQSAVFDYIKENKLKDKNKQPQNKQAASKDKNFFNFWK